MKKKELTRRPLRTQRAQRRESGSWAAAVQSVDFGVGCQPGRGMLRPYKGIESADG